MDESVLRWGYFSNPTSKWVGPVVCKSSPIKIIVTTSNNWVASMVIQRFCMFGLGYIPKGGLNPKRQNIRHERLFFLSHDCSPPRHGIIET